MCCRCRSRADRRSLFESSDQLKAPSSGLRGREKPKCISHASFTLPFSLPRIGLIPALLFLRRSCSLQERKEIEWGDRVTLLFGDMRAIDVPEKADIIVSELLGSFGDNELSPECLDGAMRFLKRAYPFAIYIYL